MVAGTIIGASIFVQPSEIARHLETPLQIMIVWAACGVLTLCGAMVCAELASAFPQTGGVYVFMRDTFSPLAGFLWGWAMFWSMHTGIVAAIAMVFARYAAFFVPVGDRGVRIIAVAVIVALSALNYAGVRAGSRVQTILTGAKVAAIVVLVAIGLLLAGDTAAAPVVSHVSVSPGAGFPREFLLAMVAGLFAYGGWHMVTYTAGETRMPATVIPSALVAGVAIVTACYVALNLVYLRVLPLEVVRSSTRIAADAADAVAGRGGSAMMAALVMVSSVGALTGIILTGPRVYYSMAQDGLAPRWLGHIHPVHRTPSHAIVAQALWASALAATGAYRQVFTRVIYTEWLFFALMAAGLFVLRRRPGYKPEYRTWGYPIVPLVFIVVSLAIVINQFASEPVEAVTGLGWSPSARRSIIGAMRIIDFHNHYYPPAYIDALRTSASAVKVTYDTDGNPCVHYPGDYNILVPGHRDIAYRQGVLDELGVTTQVLSFTTPGVHVEAREVAIRLAREINDAFARVVRERSGRFTALATLPLNDPAASVTELERAMKDLGLPGAMVFSNVNHVALADERFAPLWKKADELGAVVYIHPTDPAGVEAMLDYWLMPLVGFLMDTTLAASKLVFSGVVARHPRIRWVLTHMGGAIPYLAERLDRGYRAFAECRRHIDRPPTEYLRHFYYDTVNFNPAAVRLALDFAGPDRILAGSDYPHQIGSIPLMIETIRGLDVGEDVKRKIFGANAAALLGLA